MTNADAASAGFRRFLISLATGATLGCTAREAQSRPDSARPAPTVAAIRASPPEPADNDVLHNPGVPTDPDDTAATRYGKHETPRRLSNPGCRPQGLALCLRDTATTVYSVACCMADQRRTDWMVFAAARDSMQLFLDAPRNTYLTMAPSSAEGAGAETSRGVDASWFRARLPAAGTYVFTVNVESDSAVGYELRVAPVVTTGASQPTGRSAGLTLNGKRKRIAVAPRSMMLANDTAAMRRFAVDPGRYRVLLVRDTLYSACALPCVNPTIFTLKPGQAVAITP